MLVYSYSKIDVAPPVVVPDSNASTAGVETRLVEVTEVRVDGNMWTAEAKILRPPRWTVPRTVQTLLNVGLAGLQFHFGHWWNFLVLLLLAYSYSRVYARWQRDDTRRHDEDIEQAIRIVRAEIERRLLAGVREKQEVDKHLSEAELAADKYYQAALAEVDGVDMSEAELAATIDALDPPNDPEPEPLSLTSDDSDRCGRCQELDCVCATFFGLQPAIENEPVPTESCDHRFVCSVQLEFERYIFGTPIYVDRDVRICTRCGRIEKYDGQWVLERPANRRPQSTRRIIFGG